jgi:hypothetical protein
MERTMRLLLAVLVLLAARAAVAQPSLPAADWKEWASAPRRGTTT